MGRSDVAPLRRDKSFFRLEVPRRVVESGGTTERARVYVCVLVRKDDLCTRASRIDDVGQRRTPIGNAA